MKIYIPPEELEFWVQNELNTIEPPNYNASNSEILEYTIDKWAHKDFLEFIQSHRDLAIETIFNLYLDRTKQLAETAIPNTSYYTACWGAYSLCDAMYDRFLIEEGA